MFHILDIDTPPTMQHDVSRGEQKIAPFYCYILYDQVRKFTTGRNLMQSVCLIISSSAQSSQEVYIPQEVSVCMCVCVCVPSRQYLFP